MKNKQLHPVTVSRLRLTQRLLVAASDLDQELLADDHWQKAMIHTASLLARTDAHPSRKIKVLKQLAAAHA